jgi:hypothetical protein
MRIPETMYANSTAPETAGGERAGRDAVVKQPTLDVFKK